jgi:PBP1b-binding outer membrane lipoprotein LpoB
MKMNKKLIVPTLLMGVFLLGGCSRESEKVSYNVSQEADNFNVVRRVAVINTRTDKVEFEVIGRISIDAYKSDQLEIIVEAEKGVYKKHIINMTDWNMYIVEDLEGAQVDQYQYEVNYMPESIIPFTITENK